MFVVVIAALMMGYPVVFTLAGVGFAFGLIGHLFGAFDLSYFNALPLRYWGILNNDVLIAVPLFIYMGVMLERSGIAEDLLRTLGEVFGRLHGGLGFSVILVGSLLAASTGIVGATVTTMALISLPAMLRTGYNKELASGLIAATGTLAQIIPPSTVLVFLAVIMQTANSQVQLAKGNFVPQTLSVGDLFAGAFIPGLILSCLYALWVIVMIVIRPNSAPPMVTRALTGSLSQGGGGAGADASADRRRAGLDHRRRCHSDRSRVGRRDGRDPAHHGADDRQCAVRSVCREDQVERALFWYWIATVVLLTVLAVTTGAKGVLTGSVLMTAAALLFILLRGDTRPVFVRVLTGVAQQSLNLTVMVFVIFLGATVFSLVFTRLGGEAVVGEFLSRMPGGAHGAVFVVMFIVFILGMFLDTFEILFIVVPISAPILLKMDVDPVWLSIMLAINLQTSYLTPPFGFSLFFLRGVAPPEVTTGHIYRGIVPFVGLQIICARRSSGFSRSSRPGCRR